MTPVRIPPIPGRFWVRPIPEASPQPEALEIVEALRAGDGRGRQVACLLDSKGMVVCAATDATDRSPIRIAVLETIRLFASVADLLPSDAGRELKASGLTMVVTMPFGSDAEIVCSLGGVGSFLEGPIGPRALPYVQLLDASSADVAYVQGLLGRFPPFYTEVVGLSVGPSSSRRLTTWS